MVGKNALANLYRFLKVVSFLLVIIFKNTKKSLYFYKLYFSHSPFIQPQH